MTALPDTLIMATTAITPEVAIHSESGDLEMGSTSTASDQQKAEVQVDESPVETAFIAHTDEELLKQAREMSSSGKFIFTCYSELNTFLLLQQQDDILKLQCKLYDSINGPGPWTEQDLRTLQDKMKVYRTFAIDAV